MEDSEREAHRDEVIAAFNDPAHPVRILIVTNVASENLNLQETARYVLLYDVPWNPARLEQRNGLLDRHGQARDVVVHHFATDDDADRTRFFPEPRYERVPPARLHDPA